MQRAYPESLTGAAPAARRGAPRWFCGAICGERQREIMKRKLGADEASSPLRNKRVTSLRPLLPPAILTDEISVPNDVAHLVARARGEVDAVVKGQDDRLLIIVGPCSIHDPAAALAYARELKRVRDELSDELLIVMRVYFEKPRTTVGWKGLINDPDLTGACNINKGLRTARQLLLDINALGVPASTEFLDSISPQFTADLMSWGAIGARTTESQIHRELASGLSCAIGFKNGSSGDVQIAVDAIQAASHPHSFLGVTEQGLAAIVSTTGNDAGHIILRGGSDGTNYDAKSVQKVQAALDKAKITSGIMIDCSHGNSNKDYKNQPIVARDVAAQVEAGNSKIVGLMIESNIHEGAQKLVVGTTDPATLKYGVSVTDSCINLETTRILLKDLANAVKLRRAKNKTASVN